MVLTRQEKEGLVIDLYNQGKNTRQITQQVGISFRDIGADSAKSSQRERKTALNFCFVSGLRLVF